MDQSSSYEVITNFKAVPLYIIKNFIKKFYYFLLFIKFFSGYFFL